MTSVGITMLLHTAATLDNSGPYLKIPYNQEFINGIKCGTLGLGCDGYLESV